LILLAGCRLENRKASAAIRLIRFELVVKRTGDTAARPCDFAEGVDLAFELLSRCRGQHLVRERKRKPDAIFLRILRSHHGRLFTLFGDFVLQGLDAALVKTRKFRGEVLTQRAPGCLALLFRSGFRRKGFAGGEDVGELFFRA